MQSDECPPFVPETARVYVTMVHGTWATDTPWVKENSLLRQSLNTRFGPVGFRSIGWTGKNSHAARMNGGEKLRRCLSERAPPPDSKHFIIAHSHGGNIALYAMQDEALNNSISGIVCMATPFICVRERELSRTLIFPMASCFAVGLFLVFKPTEIPGGQIFAWGVLLCAALCLVLWLASAVTFRKTKARARTEFLKSLRLPEFDSERLLIVRPTGDEASGGLVTSQFLSWAVILIWKVMDRVYEVFVRWRQKASGVIGVTYFVVAPVLLGILGLFGITLVLWDISALDLLRSGSVLFLAIIGLVILIFGLYGLVLATALIASQCPFGFDAIRHCFTLQTTAESSPPFELQPTPDMPQHSTTPSSTVPKRRLSPSQVVHVSLPPLKPTERDLDHSRLYTFKEVVDQIVDWIESRVNFPKK